MITIATIITLFIFDKFEENKMEEGLVKFIKLDKYRTDFKKAEESLKGHESDSVFMASFQSAESKLKKAEKIYAEILPLVKNYDKIGADSIANYAVSNDLLKDIEVSRLKDEVRNANNFLILEALSVENKEKKQVYDIAKVETEKYKEPLKKLISNEISADSAIVAMNAIYPVDPKNIDAIKFKIKKFDIKQSFKKDIEKSDNHGIVWGIGLTALLFMLIYLYVEKIKTPTAYSVASMFKKLQLFSSAAFSVGHGGNDAQKVMGIIGAALIASGSIQDFGQLPNWVPISCYLAIGLGTITAGAFTLFFTGQMGIPVSTTHTITGSIIGVGATKRLSAVRWGVTTSLIIAWILTIPVSAILAALVYWISTFFF